VAICCLGPSTGVSIRSKFTFIDIRHIGTTLLAFAFSFVAPCAAITQATATLQGRISPAFGRITNTRCPTGESGSSRQVQFALKLIF